MRRRTHREREEAEARRSWTRTGTGGDTVESVPSPCVVSSLPSCGAWPVWSRRRSGVWSASADPIRCATRFATDHQMHGGAPTTTATRQHHDSISVCRIEVCEAYTDNMLGLPAVSLPTARQRCSCRAPDRLVLLRSAFSASLAAICSAIVAPGRSCLLVALLVDEGSHEHRVKVA